jgi:hypothetical protein
MTLHAYKMFNGPMPTTAAQASVATANGIKTMLQGATPSTRMARILEWGYSFDVASAGIMTVELLQTDVAATVTAHAASGVQPLDPNAPASLLTLGTSATGYTASAEGSITATRVFDAVKIPIAGGDNLKYTWQWTPASAPEVAISKFFRVRVTATTTTPTMLCWVIVDGC